MELEVCGQVVGGGIARIVLRQKSAEEIELGDLLIIDGEEGGYVILRVYDLAYGSQVSHSSREMLAGMRLEGYGAGLEFMEPELRNYVLAEAKPILQVTRDKEVSTPKLLPAFFSSVRRIAESDLDFLTKPEYPVYLGKVRSGTKILDVDIHLNGVEAFTHHILVPAITGRGKSNLVKVMLWSVLDQESFGVLVLDPHDEYYGRHGKGLKDHPTSRDRLLYYSPTPVTGTNTLVINLHSIHPSHFDGIVEFSEAQQDAINLYYNNYQEDWIENIVRGTEVGGVSSRTLAVIQRKFDIILGVYVDAMGDLQCRNRVFSNRAGEATVGNIIDALEEGKTAVIDTSRLIDEAELLIGSIIVGAVFNNYQRSKARGMLGGKPNVSVVIEEAPRVLAQDVLATKGKNIYSTIAREGRKFKVGLIAITQLTSMIPRIILTNMNTKIVLGNEMALERRAIIESAAQDLSDDDRTIASLDTGEALVTSNFTNFAVPIQIPLFEDYIEEQQEEEEEEEEEMAFEGVDIQ